MTQASITSTSDRVPHTDEVPVLISGAGPVGLTTSILLSRQGIRNWVVEKRDTVNTLPRARGITVRTVEILTHLGLGDELDRIALPRLWTKSFVYTEKLAGDLIGIMSAIAMESGTAAQFTPADYRVAAQDRIDPMLYNAAVSYPEASIRFGTEVTGYREDNEGIVTTVRNSNGTMSRIRSQYLVAADGGKSPLRELAGIAQIGRSNLRSFINNHIRADFSQFTQGREGALIWTLAPGVEGVFQMLDGKDKWAVQVQYDPETFDHDIWTEEHALAHLRAMIGDPAAEDVKIEILKSYRYTLSMMVSDQLRKGRLILTGDAAHQIPPYGGFGMNTGIQSAHNLAWKLGAVIRGEAGSALLDTYDIERREVAHRVIDFGRKNAGYVEQLMTAVRQASSAEEKSAIISASRQYGNWWGLDLGVHYEGDGAFVPDDVQAPEVSDPVIEYIPHAKPGYRAPHFWAMCGDQRVSSIYLCHERFVLLAGPEGSAWVAALEDSGSSIEPKIEAYRVAVDGDLVPDVDFCELYGIGPSGAVLVRPDGHVAFRAQSLPTDPLATLKQVLDHVLCRRKDVARAPAKAVAAQ
jgi:2-polyprenyl-6-methoxyphenol hydroxylase-like FAD-dependent oxidoreductase